MHAPGRRRGTCATLGGLTSAAVPRLTATGSAAPDRRLARLLVRPPGLPLALDELSVAGRSLERPQPRLHTAPRAPGRAQARGGQPGQPADQPAEQQGAEPRAAAIAIHTWIVGSPACTSARSAASSSMWWLGPASRSCVLCSGMKSLLDVTATAELLETLGVLPLGWRTGGAPLFLPLHVGALDGDDVVRIELGRPGLAPGGDIAAGEDRDRGDHPPIAQEEPRVVDAPRVRGPCGDLLEDPLRESQLVHYRRAGRAPPWARARCSK